NGAENSSFKRKYLDQELLEVSAVGIPANPDALRLAYKSGAIGKSEVQELLCLLSHLVTDKKETDFANTRLQGALCPPSISNKNFVGNGDSPTTGCRGGSSCDGTQLLQLVRALRAFLRRS